MIYHITFPHRPFLQGSLEIFEEVIPNNNKVILITNKQNEDNLCNIDKDKLLYKGPLTSDVVKMVNSDDCSGVYIYWLSDEIIDLILMINKDKPIYWRTYGPDINSFIYKSSSEFLGPETKKLLNTNYIKKPSNKVIRLLSLLYKGKLFDTLENRKKRKLFLKRVDYIGTVTNYEYEQLKMNQADFKAEYLYSIMIKPESNPSLSINAKNIMIGHSSHSINNHADVFKVLANMKSHNTKLVAPLSYGDKVYAEKVIKLGKKLFSERFVAIEEYMPIEEYNDVIDSCHTFISNSYIQQGGANISRFLLTGGKVYLHEKSPIYNDRKKQGFKIFTVQNDLTYEHLYEYQLSENDKMINRQLLLSMFYNEEKVKSFTKKIIKVLGVKF